jgi:serine/threonine-protein kinase
MQQESAQDLIETLRASGLFTDEQFAGVVRDLTPMSGNAEVLLKHLVGAGHLTNYQIRKFLNGKTSDLLVGPYVITDKLGSGGMGRVYRARRTADGLTVALKVVRAAMVQNPTVRGRYAREVQAARALDHPNIVGMIGAGEAAGRVYLAMEFVDGIDLARLMRDFGMVAIEEACEYGRQAALGLQHAHEHGFVHRDVKPSNVVVAGERHLPQATEPARVKLLDLGLARAIDPDAMVAPDLTRDHAVVGTPDYMAPEQAKNSRGADPRSDLYALGCTLYFLLTGRVPFPYASAIEKILAHQSEPPSPLQALRPEVPAAVAAIVVKLMSKRPEDRFQTAGELAEALAPHSRYPQGAAPVEIVPVRDDSRRETVVDSGTGLDRPALPPGSSSGSSVAQFSPLALEFDGAQPVEPRAQPVAPSDHTPRPRGFTPPDADPPRVRVPASAVEVVESDDFTALVVTPAPRSHSRRRVRHTGARRSVPAGFVWLAVSLLGAFLALLVWLVTKS